MAAQASSDAGVLERAAGSAGAFISYSREESAEVAVALQTALERFAKPWYRLRAIRVFRDDTNMSANADLRGTIEAALGRSGWFILLASPKAARSPWVESEIRWWLDHRSADRIMLVQTAGEIGWHPAGDRFDIDRSPAIPPVLERAFPREPRWIDLRWFAAPESLRAADPRFDERVADLAAPIHGRERADLVGENVRQHRRAVRLARGGVAVLCVLLAVALVTAVVAVRASREARVQRDQAVQQNVISVARQLSATAVNLTATDLQRASLLAVHAYRLHADGQTAAALFATATATPQLVGFLDAGAAVTATDGTTDGRYVIAGTSAGDVWRWDRRTGVRERLLRLTGAVSRIATNGDGRFVAAWAATDPDEPTGAGSGSMWSDGTVTTVDHQVLAVSPSGRYVVDSAPTTDGGATLRVLRSGTAVFTRTVPYPPQWALLPADDRLVLVDQAGPLNVFALPSGRHLVDSTATSGAHPFTAAVDPTGAFVAVTNQAKNVEIDPVQNLASGSSDVVPAGFGRTETPNAVDFALSPGAEKLATAVDGRIWVGAVARGAHAIPPAPVVLAGTGTARTGTLRFLNSHVLVSGSGTAVGVWDLDQDGRVGRTIPVRYDFSCNACGPGSTLVSPAGTRALLVSNQRDFVALADLQTGASSYGSFGGGDLAPLLGTHPLWLDDDDLFTWDDQNAVASVWSGPRLGQLARRWNTPALRRPAGQDDPQVALVLRAGQVLLVDGTGRMITVDPVHQTTVVSPTRLALDQPTAIGLDPAGTRLWALTTTPDDPHTRVQVFDTGSGAVLVDRSLDGQFGYGDLTGTSLLLWGARSPSTTLDLASGAVATDGRVLRPGSAVARAQPFEVSEDNGTVTVYDTHLRAAVGTFGEPTGAYAWTEIGFSPDARTMVLATAATDEDGHATARSMRLGYDQWSAVDCATAGRDLTADEWRAVTDLAVPADLRCHP